MFTTFLQNLTSNVCFTSKLVNNLLLKTLLNETKFIQNSKKFKCSCLRNQLIFSRQSSVRNLNVSCLNHLFKSKTLYILVNIQFYFFNFQNCFLSVLDAQRQKSCRAQVEREDGIFRNRKQARNRKPGGSGNRKSFRSKAATVFPNRRDPEREIRVRVLRHFELPAQLRITFEATHPKFLILW